MKPLPARRTASLIIYPGAGNRHATDQEPSRVVRRADPLGRWTRVGVGIAMFAIAVVSGQSAETQPTADAFSHSLSVTQAGRTWEARLSLSALPQDLRLSLNGRPVTHLFNPHLTGSQTVALAPDDGLRFGSNRLVAEADYRDQSIPAQTVSFNIGRSKPLASAGPNRRVRAGTLVQLDGSGSLLRSQLRQANWQLLRAPAGSQARLQQAGSLRPTLIPDLPGTYRVQLDLRDFSGAQDSDIVNLQATPNYPSIGLALETMAQQQDGSYAMVLGGNCGPEMAGCAPRVYPYGDDPVQLLIVDRGTLETVFNHTYANTGADAVAAYAEINAQPADGSTLVVLAALPQSQPVLSSAFAAAWQLLLTPPSGDPAGSDFDLLKGGWSLLGVAQVGSTPPAGPAGFLSTGGINGPAAGQAGNLTGYLQQTSFSINDNTSTSFTGYNFVAAGYADYNTSVARTGSPLTNTMRINGVDYPSQTAPAECIGSFHLVMLRADTLGQLDNIDPSQTFFTNCGDNGTGPELLQVGWLADTISTAIQVGAQYGGALIFLQGMGTPLYQNPDPRFDGIREYASEQLSALIESLGGVADVFNKSMYSTTGNASYALAGSSALHNDMPASVPIPPYAPEASGAATGMNADKLAFLDGTLKRNRYGHFEPVTGAAALTKAALVPTIAYQPATAWPTGQTAGEQAALIYLNDTVLQLASPQDLPQPCYQPAFHNVRYRYCDPNVQFGNTGTGWQAVSTTLVTTLDPPACLVAYPGADKVSFSAQDWNAVCIGIGQEAAWVHRVHLGISQLTGFYLQAADASSNLQKTAQDVVNDLAMSDSAAATAGFWVSLAADAINILAAAVSGGTDMTIEAAATGVIGNTGALAGEVLAGSDGSSYLGQTETIASDLPTEVYDRYFAAGTILGDLTNIVVGDYGKLKALGDTYYSEVLDFDDTTLGNVVGHLKDAATLFTYGRLLGSAYNAYGLLPDGYNPGYPASPSSYECTDEFNYHPFDGYGTENDNVGPSWIGLTVPNIPTPLPIYGGNPNLLVIADVQMRQKWDWQYAELAAGDPPVAAMQSLFSKTVAWAPAFFRHNFRVQSFSCEGVGP